MKKISLLAALLLLFSFVLQAQEEEPETSFELPKRSNPLKGSDKGTTYWGFGFVVGPDEYNYGEMLYGTSTDFVYGVRNFIGKKEGRVKLGTSYYYRYQDYRLEQNQDKTFPTTTLFDKEKIITHSIGLELFGRVRFDQKLSKKHGLGLDLGVWGEWYAGSRHKTKLDLDETVAPYSKEAVSITKKLDYLNRWHYGALARLNLKNFNIYGIYRLSNIFKDDFKRTDTENYDFGDFSPFTVGISLEL